MPNQSVDTFDVVVIGAGVTGLYTLYRLCEAGYSTCVLEGGSGVGGTWYWSRYPGCRFDSESYAYVYTFDKELLEEWDIRELYAPQRDTERNLNYFTDRFDLRKHIRFDEWVTDAIFDEAANEWETATASGYRVRSRFLIAAVGLLSARHVPDFAGLETFEGVWSHTNGWPEDGIEVAGKRVGVIGTGATGVQLIPEIAHEVDHLYVFQRTANYCIPLRNREVDEDMLRQIRNDYPSTFEAIKTSPTGFMHQPDPRSAFDVSEEERIAQYECLWAEPGFKKWRANFYDISVPGPANEDYAQFIRQKIRERVNDPEVAAKLMPDHLFLSKRPPGETGYYEAFNLPNVTLVDARDEPIERIEPTGIRTTLALYDLDVIILATGYDAVTGSLTRINIVGEASETIKEKYESGYQSYLGLLTAGFPNFFTEVLNAGGTFVPNMEPIVDWVVELLKFMRERGLTRVLPTDEAEHDWGRLVKEATETSIRGMGSHWAVGANIPGKARTLLTPPLTSAGMRAKLESVATKGYEGLQLS